MLYRMAVHYLTFKLREHNNNPQVLKSVVYPERRCDRCKAAKVIRTGLKIGRCAMCCTKRIKCSNVATHKVKSFVDARTTADVKLG